MNNTFFLVGFLLINNKNMLFSDWGKDQNIKKVNMSYAKGEIREK